MRSLTLLSLVLITIVLGGCGAGKADDAAKAMRGLTSKLSGSGSAGSASGLTVRDARDEIRAQAWVMKFEDEAGIERVDDTVRNTNTTTDADLGCTASGCTPNSAGDVASCTISCTSPADDSFACKDVTYTVHKASTVTLAFGNTGQKYNFTFDMNATLSGGDFTNTAIVCHAAFAVDLTNPDDVTIDCANAANKCTVGGETIGCDDLNSEMDSEDNAC